MTRLVLVLFGLAGCDKLLSLGPITPVIDARPALGCSGQAAFLCGDFETGAVLYGDGVAFNVPKPPADITAIARPPGSDSTNALWVDTGVDVANDTYKAPYTDARVVTKLHADLDVQIAQDPATYAIEIAEIGVDETTDPHCYIQLQLEAQQRVNIREACNNGTGMPEQIFAAIPVGWQHYTLDFDVAAGTASATVQNITTSLTLPYTNPGGGTPHAAIGVFAVSNGSGPLIGFDNVLVTVQ